MELARLLREGVDWSWIVPPLAGAVIGYFTNYLAIRMLFRPLEKKYLFGLPLPLTPGIIPARRRELAKKIAEMVGEHLLTREVIVGRLESPALDDALYRWVSARFYGLIEKDLGPPLSLLPEELRCRWQKWWGRGWKPVYQVVDRFLESPDLGLMLSVPVNDFSHWLLQRNLDELLPADRQAELRSRISQLLQRGLSSSRLRRRLETGIDRLAQDLMTSKKPLGELLPADFQNAVLAELHRELPGLLVRFSRLLYDPAIRRQLKQKLYTMINLYIEKMGFWRRLVTSWALSDEEIRRKIDQLVDEVAADFAESLRQPEWQERVFNLLAERFAALLALSPAEITGRISFARVSRGWVFLRRRLTAWLTAPERGEQLLEAAFELFESRRRQPLGELLRELGLTASGTGTAARLTEAIVVRLRSRRVKRRLTIILAAKLSFWLENRPLGRISNYLPAAHIDPLIGFCYRQLRSRLAAELPRLSENFAVKQVVEERINQLPVIKVEELLLSIMREHFLYINLFGALVGGLIGIIQVVLLHFLG